MMKRLEKFKLNVMEYIYYVDEQLKFWNSLNKDKIAEVEWDTLYEMYHNIGGKSKSINEFIGSLDLVSKSRLYKSLGENLNNISEFKTHVDLYKVAFCKNQNFEEEVLSCCSDE